MIIAITKETLPNESRVSLTPHSCADFVKSGYKIRIESGAGLHSYYTDEEYKKAIFDSYEKSRIPGANIVNYQNIDKYLSYRLIGDVSCQT